MHSDSLPIEETVARMPLGSLQGPFSALPLIDLVVSSPLSPLLICLHNHKVLGRDNSNCGQRCMHVALGPCHPFHAEGMDSGDGEGSGVIPNPDTIVLLSLGCDLAHV